MDEMNPHFTVRTSLSFLILTLLQTSGLAADMCSADSIVTIAENNAPGAIVTNITTEPGVTLEFSDAASTHDNTFRLEGNQLIAAKALDYESKEEYSVRITCSNPAIGPPLPITIVVIVNNVNDNPPVFSKSLEEMIVNEMSPVGTTVGRFTATDGDNDLLYYTLTSELNDFKLKSPTNPDILVNRLLDYDKVKKVQLVLYAQDTPLTSTKSTASFTASTTIMVTIVDVDNRPPWFQPCTKYELGGALVCLSSSYTGRVVLNEKESGVLPLKPGPLYAIDGDSDINGEITYAFVSGNEDGLFEINPDTGNITMLKPADVLGTITLTVVAAQRINTFQFTSTTVTISVQVKSLHPPKFQSPQYEGIITAVGTMAMDMTNKDKPLQILAKDDDYIATEGFNPHISYSIEGRSDFIILDGFLFMTEDLPESTVPLKVVATDTSNEESSTARLSVVVKTGLTTTSLPLNTTDMTTSVGESTTDHSSNSSTTSDASSTTNPMVISPGGYGVVDMAALGATLGVLLFVCLVVIGVLIHRMRKGKADWRKMFEASMFQSSLGKGAGGHKEGIQYTNEAFENDEDGGSMGSSDPAGGGGMSGGEPRRVAADMPLKEATAKSSTSLHGLLPDDMSQAGSDASDEKEVKPILTKERRMEEGYKAVWFKEDIDPNAKEEVVIISDNREEDSEEDEQSFSGRDEDDEDNPKRKTSKVVIAEADLDSGLGVKIEDRGEDSDDDEVLNVDL
ncbi:cadherin-related family member 5 isoform X2 [Channa argus]|uniref:cadherin-related family member 5 isoform X2 n=1 Tax=Channa argus TaxID=215402 RepID=UPI0035212D09